MPGHVAPAGGSAAPGASSGTSAGLSSGSAGADDGAGELEEDVVEGGEGGGQRPTREEPKSFRETFDQIRKDRAAAAGTDGGEGAEGAEEPEGGAEGAGEGEGEGTGEVDDTLVVDLGARREGEEPLRIVTEDQEIADAIRGLQKRALDRDTVFRIREEADDVRAEAEEMRYAVDLDPGSFVLERMTNPADRQHLARVLLTQPGVLDSMKDWVSALLEHPEAIPAQARIERAEAIERKGKVSEQVNQRRQIDGNERTLIRTTHRSLQSLLPQALAENERAYNTIFADVMAELSQTRQARRVSMLDPRIIPGIIQSRLSLYGVAPATRTAKDGGGKPPAGKKPAARQPTGEDLKRTADARRRAAGAGPGAGSPAATMPKAPPAKAGESSADRWKRTFNHLRTHLPSLRRAPQS